MSDRSHLLQTWEKGYDATADDRQRRVEEKKQIAYHQRQSEPEDMLQDSHADFDNVLFFFRAE